MVKALGTQCNLNILNLSNNRVNNLNKITNNNKIILHNSKLQLTTQISKGVLRTWIIQNQLILNFKNKY